MGFKIMTSKEYVKTGGDICPYCGSVSIELEENIISADSKKATQKGVCWACETVFTQTWKLTGFHGWKEL